jgi:regulator of RNase E activity RraA
MALDRGGALDGLRLFGKRRRAAGLVETVAAEVTLDRNFPIENFSIGQQIQLSKPGSILLIDLGGHPVSSWGALATRSAMSRELPACVIKGGARDVEEIDEMDFLLAVVHVTPRTGKGRIRFTSRDGPLEWGRVRIEPGDWIVMDRTGAVVVPGYSVDEVAEKALEIETTDSDFVRLLEEGVDFDGASRRLGHF